MALFVAYGVGLESDLDLAGCLPAAKDVGATRRITVHEAVLPPPAPAFRWPFAVSHGRQLTGRSDQGFQGPATGQRWWLEVEGLATFHWTVGQTTLTYEPARGGATAALAFWLIHSVLPAFLALEGSYHFLHAAAARLGSGSAARSVQLVGPSGSGKSTLLAALLDRGAALVSDDKLALLEREDLFYAVPSHPRYRPYRRHEDLGRQAEAFAEGPVPLGALLCLRPTGSRAEVRFTEVRGADKLKAISDQLLYGFRDSARVHFGFLARLLEQAPVFELQVPQDLARVDAVSDAIVQRFGAA